MSALKGKVAWVTGAGTGIGLSAARALALAGATVIMTGRREQLLLDEAKAIKDLGGNVRCEVLDVGDPEAVDRSGARVLEDCGSIDILVNSTGTNVLTRYWDDQTYEGWRSVMSANLDGTFNTTRAVLPAMRARKDGCIINVSSWAGAHHTKLTGAAYNASKSGVIAMTETINMEEAIHGIRACAICPAEVATPLLDKRPTPPSQEERDRMLQMDDLGQTVLFVAQLPPRACVNQIIISPTWNRMYLGGFEKTSTDK